MDRSELRASAKVPRTERVAANVTKALGPMVAAWARDAGVMVSVTRVDISPDLKNARVGVSLLGSAGELGEVTRALNDDAGEFRHALASALRMKSLPRLKFVADDRIATSARISELLDSDPRDRLARDRDSREGEGQGQSKSQSSLPEPAEDTATAGRSDVRPQQEDPH